MTKHPLEQLAETNSDAEIWWDSSPLIFPSWEEKTLAAAPEGKRAEWEAQLDRFYDPDTVASQGTMGFRGVTTNPPLSLQAIQVDPKGWTDRIACRLSGGLVVTPRKPIVPWLATVSGS